MTTIISLPGLFIEAQDNNEDGYIDLRNRSEGFINLENQQRISPDQISEFRRLTSLSSREFLIPIQRLQIAVADQISRHTSYTLLETTSNNYRSTNRSAGVIRNLAIETLERNISNLDEILKNTDLANTQRRQIEGILTRLRNLKSQLS